MEALQTAFTTAISGVGDDILGFMGSALPIGLGVIAAVLAVTVGIRFFKRITKG